MQGAAYAMVRNVQFLSDMNGDGIALVYDDRDANGKLAAGSYTHTVENCYFGRPCKHLHDSLYEISLCAAHNSLNAFLSVCGCCMCVNRE